jgi:hypothetical protein
MKTHDQHFGPGQAGNVQLAPPVKRRTSAAARRSRAIQKSQAMDAVGGPLGLRERNLATAGVTAEEQGKITRAVIDSAVDDMANATVKQRLVVGTGKGTAEVQEFTDADLRARARARETLIDIVGITASKSMSNVKVTGPTTISIAFVQPPLLQQAEIIEVKEP